MDPQSVHEAILELAAAQHGVAARRQLLALGLSGDAIKHRVAVGRLHPLGAGVYAVGRPRVGRLGSLMAVVLGCGPHAVLSHASAAALWSIRRREPGRPEEVSVPARRRPRRPGVIAHRRDLRSEQATRCHGIRVTTPAQTLIDLALWLPRADLEAAVNEADKRGLIELERLRALLDARAGQRGAAILRAVLDRRTFRLTDSALERRFLQLVGGAGLPLPLTGCRLNGFRVDFLWPSLRLVVETDGSRFHRTAAQQTSDRLRDQAHAAAGFTPLRFTHAQVANHPAHVQRTLAEVARRLGLRDRS